MFVLFINHRRVCKFLLCKWRNGEDVPRQRRLTRRDERMERSDLCWLHQFVVAATLRSISLPGTSSTTSAEACVRNGDVLFCSLVSGFLQTQRNGEEETDAGWLYVMCFSSSKSCVSSSCSGRFHYERGSPRSARGRFGETVLKFGQTDRRDLRLFAIGLGNVDALPSTGWRMAYSLKK